MSATTIDIHSMPTARGAAWIADGFTLFRQAPGTWIGLWVVWMLLLLAISCVPLFGGLASALLTPVFAGGIFVGCQQAASGETIRLNHLFHCFADGHLGPLLLIGLLGMLAQLAIVLVVVVLGVAPAMAAVLADASITQINPFPILLALLVGLVLAVPLFMALWFAPALVSVRNYPPMAALRSSLVACWRNSLPLTLYGLLALAILIVAIIPLGLGLLIAGPVLTASVYTAFRDIYAVTEQ